MTSEAIDASAGSVDRWAERLVQAERTGDRLRPPPAPDLATGYAIQSAGRRRRIAAGDRPAGYKIGVTAPAGQQLYGTDEPLHGYLLESMLHRPQDGVDAAALRSPRVEAEIAFVIGETLPRGLRSRDDVLACVSHLQIALEIVDPRWDPDPHAAALLAADNVMCVGVIVGVSQPTDIADLREVTVSMQVGDQRVHGDASAVMGDPVLALDWLDRSLAEAETPLQPGDFVMSGTLCPATPFTPGDHITAAFGPLGTLRCHLS